MSALRRVRAEGFGSKKPKACTFWKTSVPKESSIFCWSLRVVHPNTTGKPMLDPLSEAPFQSFFWPLVEQSPPSTRYSPP